MCARTYELANEHYTFFVKWTLKKKKGIYMYIVYEREQFLFLLHDVQKAYDRICAMDGSIIF